MMLGTEHKGAIWYDRKLFETIISQPGERISKMAKRKKKGKPKTKKEKDAADAAAAEEKEQK